MKFAILQQTHYVALLCILFRYSLFGWNAFTDSIQNINIVNNFLSDEIRIIIDSLPLFIGAASPSNT